MSCRTHRCVRTNLHTSPALKRHAALWVHQDLILRLFTFTHRSYSTSLSLKAADRREGLKLRLGAPVTGCADDHSVSGCSLTADGNCALPYMRYWRPRNASHDAWKMPEILNDHGISLVAVKNQNSFMESPPTQLARTDSRRPLQDLERRFTRIWGSGSVASTASPM